MASFSTLPFQASSSLRLQLQDRYLVEALDWITDGGSDQSGRRVLRAVASDNPWEAAYSIISILTSRDLLGEWRIYQDHFDQCVSDGITYLLSSLTGAGNQQLSLDENPYDTSLVTQAVLYFGQVFPESDLARSIEHSGIVASLCSWIEGFIGSWLSDRTVGEVDDVSLCVRAMVLRARLTAVSTETALLGQAITELLGGSEWASGTEEDTATILGDTYGSSYLLIVYQEYLDVFPTSFLRTVLVQSIRRGLSCLERSFDGNWDQPQDTALALACYLRSARHASVAHDILPDVFFLSMRWLCDRKQRYANGSIQRSVHYTALFIDVIVLSLATARLGPEMLDPPTSTAYDYCLRQITMREPIERSRLCSLRLEQDALRDFTSDMSARLKTLRSRIYLLFEILAWLSAFAAFIVVGILSGALQLRPKLLVEKWDIVLTSGPILTGLAYSARRILRQRLAAYADELRLRVGGHELR